MKEKLFKKQKMIFARSKKKVVVYYERTVDEFLNHCRGWGRSSAFMNYVGQDVKLGRGVVEFGERVNFETGSDHL